MMKVNLVQDKTQVKLCTILYYWLVLVSIFRSKMEIPQKHF